MNAPLPAKTLLRHGAFMRFAYVRIAASVALQMQAVAVGWQMYELTGSSFQLGLVGLVQFVPGRWFVSHTGPTVAAAVVPISAAAFRDLLRADDYEPEMP